MPEVLKASLDTRHVSSGWRLALALRFAWRELTQSRLRVLLTVIGVAIGIGSVSSMLLIGYSLDARMRESLQSLGADIVSIQAFTSQEPGKTAESVPGEAGLRMSHPLSPAQFERLAGLLSAMPEVDAVGNMARVAACPQGQSMPDVELYQLDEQTQSLLNLQAAQGQLFGPPDPARPLVMLGADAVAQLQGQGRQLSVGGRIEVCGQFLEVAAILHHHKGADMLQGVRLNQAVLLNEPALLRILAQRPLPMLLARLRPSASSQQFERALSMRVQRNLQGVAVNAAGAWQISQMRREQIRLYTNFLTVIGAISLLVGSLGVANVMLASVARRQREIGLRVAIGAAREDVILQFMAESALICLAGAALGLVLGVLVSALALSLSGIGFYPSAWVLLQSAAIAVLCGLVAGFYPAKKAAELDPIVSLQGSVF